jgi:hypothetical protein
MKTPDLKGIMDRTAGYTKERQDGVPGAQGESMLSNGLLGRLRSITGKGGNRD